MIIPKLHYISQGNSPQEHVNNIKKACTSGIELVQLNLTDVSEKRVSKIAHEVREITAHFQTRLLIRNDYKLAIDCKADGVHMDETSSYDTTKRKQLFSWQMIGGTANTIQECESFIANEIDYIRLGPFRTDLTNETKSTAVGLNGYTAIIDALHTETPLVGFGGITIADVSDIIATGISGLAISEGITQNFNSIKTFNQLLNASATEEQRHTFE
jgi:thiamine-phosphate pyrophosphorylase